MNHLLRSHQRQVYRLRDGWYCMVDGREFGPWADKGPALAGMATEQRRAERRRENLARSAA